MSDEPFKSGPALGQLKAFQRRTVDYVFDRFYAPANPAYQFLVADEVGLGKTLVARGVIAKAIEHLWDKTDRIDILYICSNQAIAAQNLNRLNVLGREALALPTRMTLVPLQMRGERSLSANKVNFISLTPGTTFDLRSSTGVAEERALLFHLLRPLVSSPRGLQNLLQVDVRAERWDDRIKGMTLEGIDQPLIDRFQKEMTKDAPLVARLAEAVELFRRRRDHYPSNMTSSRSGLVSALRSKLSHACVDALQPDLIIMDEFQRFPNLLHGQGEAAELARELFDYRDSQGNAVRTLLLSATPYRMLTLQGDDAAEGDHHSDFLETLTFLFGQARGREMVKALDLEMRAFRTALHGLPASQGDALAQKAKVEASLKQVMCRTERVSSTADRDSMVCEPPLALSVQADDLRQAMLVSDVARALEAPEVIEYWKSAPYLLNFMHDYALKKAMKAKEGAKLALDLASALVAAKSACLDKAQLAAYAPINPANGRMRAVMDDVFRDGLEQNLWIPPSLPYYGDGPPNQRPTKALIFSSWTMAPDAIAAILSYEAERRMGAGDAGRGYFDQKRPRPLQFRHTDGRLAGLRALLLIYPSPVLAELGDPLAVMTAASERLSYAQMRSSIADRLRAALTGLIKANADEEGAPVADWSVPAALDALAGNNAFAWVTASDGMAALASEDAFKDHVAALRDAAKGLEVGSISEDALDLMVDVALGSPAVCALRALRRVAPELAWDDPKLLSAAAQVAWGLRALFNQHDAVAVLRRGDEDRYWHRVLTFSAEQNLQAVLDEYAHYLVDAQGVSVTEPCERVTKLGKSMADALSIRPSQIDVDNPTLVDGKLKADWFQMRGRFAMRLADYRDEEGAVARLGGVRDAFNSPFRPFVLATTSVGQEGLDFHPYCYRVYHWNLPGNPVDLEQREGRVHRFKGHAVRLNVAYNHGTELMGQAAAPADPWAAMFASARAATTCDTDLVPYWLCEGPVKVERRVPILPFSRETQRLEWLKRSLTVYRLAFGQPRQDDLLGYLGGLLDQDMSMNELEALQIRLQP